MYLSASHFQLSNFQFYEVNIVRPIIKSTLQTLNYHFIISLSNIKVMNLWRPLLKYNGFCMKWFIMNAPLVSWAYLSSLSGGFAVALSYKYHTLALGSLALELCFYKYNGIPCNFFELLLLQ